VDAPFYRGGEARLVPGVFVSRPYRFAVVARVRGRLVRVASRDPGRLSELLRPGVRLLLAPAPAGSLRRTRYTVVLVRHGPRWVSVVPALANEVLAAALVRNGVPGLRGARVLAREVRRRGSRFDFLLLHRGRRLLVEVKSATLVESGVALFPDAPTARGARHVRELAERARRGGRAAIVFVVQRDDAVALRPHAGNDPAFAAALDEAIRAGVRVLCYACRVTRQGVRLRERIPARLARARPPGGAL
jgi:sugar fermentation stimulation protein A